MKAVELLVKCFETERVRYIFGVLGEETIDFLEAIRQTSPIPR